MICGNKNTSLSAASFTPVKPRVKFCFLSIHPNLQIGGLIVSAIVFDLGIIIAVAAGIAYFAWDWSVIPYIVVGGFGTSLFSFKGALFFFCFAKERKPSVSYTPPAVLPERSQGPLPAINIASTTTDLELPSCPALGMTATPKIGVYTPDDYPMGDSLVTIKLPADRLKNFPEPIQKLLEEQGIIPEIYFQIDDASNLKGSKRFYILHSWLGVGIETDEVYKAGPEGLICFPLIGLYETLNVRGGSHWQWLEPEKTKNFEQILHSSPGGIAISPPTAMFEVDLETTTSSFHSVVIDEAKKRALVTFTIYLHSTTSPGDGRILAEALQGEDKSIEGLLTQLEAQESFNLTLLSHMQKILAPSQAS